MDFIMVNSNHGRSPRSLDILANKKRGRYINVDITSKEGILEANQLGFLDCDHTGDEILVSPVLHIAVKNVVQPNNPGAAFALLRHPGKSRVTRDDLEDAKYLLERKVVIGLTDHMSESLERFERSFGWADTKKTVWSKCYDKFANKQGSNSFRHPTVEPGSPEWDAIAQHFELDIELYEHAVDLFHCH